MAISYQSAEDLFEAARSAQREVIDYKVRLSRMRAALGPRGAASGVGGSGARSDVNGTGRIDSIIDLEVELRGAIAEDESLVSLARSVIVGKDGNGGVRALMGPLVAKTMLLYYCEAETLSRVALLTGGSESRARLLRQQGLDCVDYHGFRALMGEPDGGAEG